MLQYLCQALCGAVEDTPWRKVLLQGTGSSSLRWHDSKEHTGKEGNSKLSVGVNVSWKVVCLYVALLEDSPTHPCYPEFENQELKTIDQRVFGFSCRCHTFTFLNVLFKEAFLMTQSSIWQSFTQSLAWMLACLQSNIECLRGQLTSDSF